MPRLRELLPRSPAPTARGYLIAGPYAKEREKYKNPELDVVLRILYQSDELILLHGEPSDTSPPP
jgi:hypothetical protein